MNEKLKECATRILSLVAHQDRHGNWWGDDTNLGDVTEDAVAVLKEHFGGCPWEADLDVALCPKHGGAMAACPVGNTTFSLPLGVPVACDTVIVSR